MPKIDANALLINRGPSLVWRRPRLVYEQIYEDKEVSAIALMPLVYTGLYDFS